MTEEKTYMLGIGARCPKCQLGKGLREVPPIELGLTGFENYKILHCDICGANFVKKKAALLWKDMPYQAPKVG